MAGFPKLRSVRTQQVLRQKLFYDRVVFHKLKFSRGAPSYTETFHVLLHRKKFGKPLVWQPLSSNIVT